MVQTTKAYKVTWKQTLKQTLDLTCELGTVEQNSLTPNSRICVAFETYEQESPET